MPETLATTLEEVLRVHLEVVDHVDEAKRTLYSPLSGESLANAFESMEVHNFHVAAVFMNSRYFTELRIRGRDMLHIYSKTWLLRFGVWARLWGALVMSLKDDSGLILLGYNEKAS